MMKKLDKYIRDHREEFDDQEMPAGHMERFGALLDKQEETNPEKKSKRFHLLTIAAVAASLAIVTMLGIHFLSPENAITGAAGDGTVTVYSEFLQTNAFYKGQMESQIEDIMCKIENADPETKIQLQKDLEKILAENKEFVEQIEQTDNEELAIFYLVQHYKRNIQALEFINEKLGTHLNC